MTTYVLRITWPSGYRTFVLYLLGQRKQYSRIADAERDKTILEDLAASRARCQPGYVPPTYDVVSLP